jgi:hypothetical protein
VIRQAELESTHPVEVEQPTETIVGSTSCIPLGKDHHRGSVGRSREKNAMSGVVLFVGGRQRCLEPDFVLLDLEIRGLIRLEVAMALCKSVPRVLMKGLASLSSGVVTVTQVLYAPIEGQNLSLRVIRYRQATLPSMKKPSYQRHVLIQNPRS